MCLIKYVKKKEEKNGHQVASKENIWKDFYKSMIYIIFKPPKVLLFAAKLSSVEFQKQFLIEFYWIMSKTVTFLNCLSIGLFLFVFVFPYEFDFVFANLFVVAYY